MGVIQNQFNSALTGLTFLAQQTPGWQFGKKTNEARMGAKIMKDRVEKAGEEFGEVKNNPSVPKTEQIAKASTLLGHRNDYEDFVKENKLYLPEEYSRVQDKIYERKEQSYTRNLVRRADMERQRRAQQPMSRAQQSAQAMSTAQESAQARDAEIQTIDNNMKNYVEMIREMRANGIIKSNRQAKSMIYKAEHQEDKK